MTRLLVVSVTAVLLLGASARPAGSHYTSWYWSAGLCKHRLITDDVQLSDGRYFDVVDAQCFGFGAWRWNFRHTGKLYRHFAVRSQGSGGGVRLGVFHVTGKKTWVMTNIRLG